MGATVFEIAWGSSRLPPPPPPPLVKGVDTKRLGKGRVKYIPCICISSEGKKITQVLRINNGLNPDYVDNKQHHKNAKSSSHECKMHSVH